MVTVDRVVETAAGLLRFATPGDGKRSVVGVWPADEGSVPARHEPRSRVLAWTDFLGVVTGTASSVSWPEIVDRLASGGAAGIVVADPVPEALAAAAGVHRLTVLAAAPDVCCVPYLSQMVADLREAAPMAAAERLHVLLRRLHELSGPGSEAGVVRWLAETIDGEAFLITPDQPVPKLGGKVRLPAGRVAAIASGAAASDADDTLDGWSLRLYGLGSGPPRSVLAVARRAGDGWPAPVVEAVFHAERILSRWLRQRSAADAERAPLRTSIFQMLVAGQVDAARMAARPLTMSPKVMIADAVRVHALSVRTSRRASVAALLQDQLRDHGLVSQSTDHGNIIDIVAVDDDRVRGALRTHLADHPNLYLGASRPVPLQAVAEGRDQAMEALADATDSVGRWAEYNPHRDLAATLPGAAAHQWSQARFAPWSARPQQRGDAPEQWLRTAWLALTYGTTAAAEREGVHRNTIRHRATSVAAALGLDFDALPDRIELDLALRIRRLRPRTPMRSTPVAYTDLLNAPEAAAWAGELIGRFDEPVLTVLVTWLDCDLSTRQAARGLALHEKTVRSRLRRAEALMRRSLISVPARFDDETGGDHRRLGVHDLILAAHITGVRADARLPAVLAGAPLCDATS